MAIKDNTRLIRRWKVRVNMMISSRESVSDISTRCEATDSMVKDHWTNWLWEKHRLSIPSLQRALLIHIIVYQYIFREKLGTCRSWLKIYYSRCQTLHSGAPTLKKSSFTPGRHTRIRRHICRRCRDIASDCYVVRPFVSHLIHLFFSSNSTRYHIRYHDGMKLAGIIYLHEISLDRVTGTALKNQNLFKMLCGDDALQHVVLVTTKWRKLDSHDLGVERETELSDIFWKDMLRNGSSIMRFDGTAKSAQTIVYGILSKRSINVTLRIQEELVDLKKYLPQTDAGKTLYNDLQRLHDRLKGELTRLRDMDRAGRDAEWRKEYADVMDRIQTIVTEIKSFKVPLTQKILGLVGLQRGISFRCVHSRSVILLWSSLIYYISIDSQR